MKPMTIIGAILIVAGIAGFVFGGFGYSETETVAEIGNVQVQDTDEERVNLSPYASGAILATGLVLLVLGARRRS